MGSDTEHRPTGTCKTPVGEAHEGPEPKRNMNKQHQQLTDTRDRTEKGGNKPK